MQIRQVFDASVQLSSLQRYSMTKLVNPESVLEHQGSVSLMGILIALKLNSLGENYNVGEIAIKASIHDLDEIGTGDIPRPTKYNSSELRDMLDTMAEGSVLSFFDKLGVRGSGLWSTAKENQSGTIVSLCDGLAVLCKVQQEVCLFGNKLILSHAGPIESMLDSKFHIAKSYCQTLDGADFLSGLQLECDSIIKELA